MSDHSSTISVSITLDSVPTTPSGFGVPTLMVDEAQGTGNGLNGDRYAEYSSVAEAQTARTAGHITAEVLAAITACFAQPKDVSAIRVCRVDTVGGETYSQALAKMLEAPPSTGIWLFFMDSRTGATVEAFAATIEASDYFLIAQSSDGDWYTSGWPAAFADLESYERTAVVFHDEDSEWADVAWGCNRIAWDLDIAGEGSGQWECELSGVAAYTTTLTSAQIAFAKANNVAVIGTLFGSASRWVDPGHNQNGRAIYEILTADWFAQRCKERLADLVVQQSARNRKIILAPSGQAMVRAVVQGLVDDAIAARHFVEGQVVLTTPTLTAADLAARRIRLEGTAQLAGSARTLSISLYFTRDQVVVAP